MTTNDPAPPDADMVWDALQAAARDIGNDLSPELLRKAYLIQRRHQFDQPDQRQVSLQDLTRLVEEFVAASEEEAQ